MEEKYELQALQAPCTGEAWEKHGSAYSLVDTHTNYKNTHTHRQTRIKSKCDDLTYWFADPKVPPENPTKQKGRRSH